MAEEENTEEDETGVELTVKRSPISGSGIARIHMNVLDEGELEEGKPALIGLKDGKTRVLRIVADRMIEEDRISLRQKDMDKIGVAEGDKIILTPYKSIGKRIGTRFFGRRSDEA